jgi:hypothetical protein
VSGSLVCARTIEQPTGRGRGHWGRAYPRPHAGRAGGGSGSGLLQRCQSRSQGLLLLLLLLLLLQHPHPVGLQAVLQEHGLVVEEGRRGPVGDLVLEVRQHASCADSAEATSEVGVDAAQRGDQHEAVDVVLVLAHAHQLGREQHLRGTARLTNIVKTRTEESIENIETE